MAHCYRLTAQQQLGPAHPLHQLSQQAIRPRTYVMPLHPLNPNTAATWTQTAAHVLDRVHYPKPRWAIAITTADCPQISMCTCLQGPALITATAKA